MTTRADLQDPLAEPATKGPNRRIRFSRRVWAPAMGMFLVVAIWQGTVTGYGLDSVVLPTPVQVLQSLVDLLGSTTFWHDAGTSALEFAIGYSAGVTLGIAAGLVISELPALRATVHPVIETFRFIVPFAWIPLTVLWFGTSLWGKTWLVGYAVFFVMVVSTPQSLRQIDPTLIRVGTMLGMGRWRRLLTIHLRAAAPSIASAARAAAAIGWIAVVAAEYVGSSSGLGYLIINAASSLNTGVVIAGMVVIGAIGASLSAVISWLITHRLNYS